MLRKFIYVIKKKKKKRGKGLPNTNMQDLLQKEDSHWSSLWNLLLRYSLLDLQDAELTWGLFEAAIVIAKFLNCLNAYIT